VQVPRSMANKESRLDSFRQEESLGSGGEESKAASPRRHGEQQHHCPGKAGQLGRGGGSSALGAGRCWSSTEEQAGHGRARA